MIFIFIFSTVGSRTAGKVSQVHLLGKDNSFDGTIWVFMSGPRCFHGIHKSGTLH